MTTSLIPAIQIVPAILRTRISGSGMRMQMIWNRIRKMMGILMKKNQIWDHKDLGPKRKQPRKSHQERYIGIRGEKITCEGFMEMVHAQHQKGNEMLQKH